MSLIKENDSKRDSWNAHSYFLDDEITVESTGTKIRVEDIYCRVDHQEILDFCNTESKTLPL